MKSLLLLIVSLVLGVGPLIQNLGSWHEILTPASVGQIAISAAGVVMAFLTKRPGSADSGSPALGIGSKGLAGLLVLGLLAASGSACATSASPQCNQPANGTIQKQCLYQSFDRQLKTAIAAYEETMIAAGAAAERKLITAEQLATIHDAGVKAHAALIAGRAALAAAVSASVGDPWGAVIDAQTALAALVEAAAHAGVAQ